MDDAGRFAVGLATWRTGVDHAKSHAETASAAAGMFAQAAFDRAFAGRCGDVPALVRDAKLLTYGRSAAFHIASAEALCLPPQQRATEVETYLLGAAHLHTVTSDVMIPLLHSAQAISAKQPMQALAALSKVESERDQPPVAAYLRGLAHSLDGQDDQAVLDLEQAANRRGYDLLSNSTVGPLAERALAELLRSQGDAIEANTAEQRFRAPWATADVQPSEKALDSQRGRPQPR